MFVYCYSEFGLCFLLKTSSNLTLFLFFCSFLEKINFLNLRREVGRSPFTELPLALERVCNLHSENSWPAPFHHFHQDFLTLIFVVQVLFRFAARFLLHVELCVSRGSAGLFVIRAWAYSGPLRSTCHRAGWTPSGSICPSQTAHRAAREWFWWSGDSPVQRSLSVFGPSCSLEFVIMV